MMDSQENALNQGKQEDNVVSENTTATVEEALSSKVYKSKSEIIERLKEIVSNDENPQKDEIDYLKTSFYKIHIAEREAKQKEYLESGGDPEQYVVTPDEQEEVFKAEMGLVKEKRQKLLDRKSTRLN